ncbi:MAG: hypothetical protein ACI4D7_05125, partial [Lachnospiraceae bacterium]
VDDILNNTIGAMIGFGLAKLVLLICRQYARRRISYFTLQLPLICTILFFAGIFITYENMEFGTMKPEQEMHYKDISVHTDLSFSSDTKDVPVYFIKKSSLEETRALADEIFEGLGTTVCPDRTDIYENTAIYWSEEDHYSIWITYMGLGYDITDFSDFDSEPATGCGRYEIETALQERGIDVPAQAVFREEENGYYRFTLSQYEEGDTMLDGYLSCRYLQTGKLASIDNYLLCYDTYRTTPILSEQEAYKKLQEGAFYCHENCNGAEIIIGSVTLDYQLDSKGFYRPVYVFSGTVDGQGAQMEVGAQK